jgi:hypothetical protein
MPEVVGIGAVLFMVGIGAALMARGKRPDGKMLFLLSLIDMTQKRR